MLNPVDPFRLRYTGPYGLLITNALNLAIDTLNQAFNSPLVKEYMKFHGQKGKLENYLNQKNLGYLAYLLDDYLIKLGEHLTSQGHSLEDGILPEYRYPEVVDILTCEHQRREEERKQEEKLDNALRKIGELQIKILLKIHEVAGVESVKWTPSNLFEDRPATEASRVSFSKALTQLKDRNLVTDTNRLSGNKKVKRTTYVKLTSLGHKAVERLKKQGEVAN